MHRSHVGVFAIIAGLTLCLSALAGPKIKLEQSSFDLGELQQRTKTDRVATITNTGDENLLIVDVKTSCGCTAALLDKDVIPPGGSAELKFTFDSREYTGKKRREIWIMSNDPDTPKTVLEMHMVIVPELQFEPKTVDFGTLMVGDTKTQVVTITANTLKAVPDVGRLVYDENYFTVTQTGGGAEPLAISISLKAEAPPGAIQQTVLVDWLSDDRRDSPIRISGQIETAIRVTPSMIYIAGKTDEDIMRVRRVAVSPRVGDGEDPPAEPGFSILAVTGLPPWLRYEAKKNGGYYDVEFTADPAIAPPQYKGQVVIRTDHPGAPEYPVTIRLFKAQ